MFTPGTPMVVASLLPKSLGLRGVAEVGDADAGFGKEAWREDVIVVAAGAVGVLSAGGFKAAAGGAAKKGAERGA